MKNFIKILKKIENFGNFSFFDQKTKIFEYQTKIFHENQRKLCISLKKIVNHIALFYFGSSFLLENLIYYYVHADFSI